MNRSSTHADVGASLDDARCRVADVVRTIADSPSDQSQPGVDKRRPYIGALRAVDRDVS